MHNARISRVLLCIENPTGFPLRVGGLPVGFFRFEMSAHKPFLFVGTHFKTGWDSKGMAIPLALGYPIGVRAPCWQRFPKGTAFPWQWFPKAAELPWQEESNETGGFVAHDFARKV